MNQDKINEIRQQQKDIKEEIRGIEKEISNLKNKIWNKEILIYDLDDEISNLILQKDVLTKKDLEHLFKIRKDTFIWARPYFNETNSESNCFMIQMHIGLGCKYVYVDSVNKIFQFYNVKDENLENKLLNKIIDFTSFNGEKIGGNNSDVIGIIENGKFKFSNSLEKDLENKIGFNFIKNYIKKGEK